MIRGTMFCVIGLLVVTVYQQRLSGNGRQWGLLISGNGSLSDCVWYKDNSDGTTHIVGTKLPNELGLYDMSGNVREWCWDWAGNYPSGARVDYRGPTNGTYRIARGDSYIDSDGWLYVFQRDLDVPYYPRSNLDTLGFRVVRQ